MAEKHCHVVAALVVRAQLCFFIPFWRDIIHQNCARTYRWPPLCLLPGHYSLLYAAARGLQCTVQYSRTISFHPLSKKRQRTPYSAAIIQLICAKKTFCSLWGSLQRTKQLWRHVAFLSLTYLLYELRPHHLTFNTFALLFCYTELALFKYCTYLSCIHFYYLYRKIQNCYIVAYFY